MRMVYVHFYHSDLQASTNSILLFCFQQFSQEEEEAKKAKKAAEAEAKKQKEVRMGWRWIRLNTGSYTTHSIFCLVGTFCDS